MQLTHAYRGTLVNERRVRGSTARGRKGTERHRRERLGEIDAKGRGIYK